VSKVRIQIKGASMKRFGVVAVVLVLAFASCAEGTEPEAQDAEPQAMTVTATDYKFAAPASAESGAVSITLTNSGEEPHQAQLFKIEDGTEIKNLVDEGKKPEPERDFSELGTWAGGPNAVDAGETQVSVAQLDAGRYAFFCQVPDAQGRSHLGLGMVKLLTVTEADAEADAPATDYSSSAKEFSFVLPESWEGNIAFENSGEQAHELQVIGIAEGKTPEDVEAWFKADPGAAGPPSWTTGGGVSVIEPGETGNFEGNVEPGTYFAMCFVADPEKKTPHFALGMMQRFEVE
jgi:hypothetical protein